MVVITVVVDDGWLVVDVVDEPVLVVLPVVPVLPVVVVVGCSVYHVLPPDGVHVLAGCVHVPHVLVVVG